IPAFAVGRTQDVLYLLNVLEDAGKIPKVPVILDSPMASLATSVFFADETDNKLNPAFLQDHNLMPAKFEVARTPDESMLITMQEGPMIVISAAGMLSGG